MTHPQALYEAFNVGTGRATSIAEIARILAKLYGVPVEPELTHKFRAGDIRHCIADISRLRGLGFAPGVDLETGLQELVAWGRTVEAKDQVEAAARELETRGLTQG